MPCGGPAKAKGLGESRAGKPANSPAGAISRRRRPSKGGAVFYSAIELLTAFSPNFTAFLILRALFGIGMGGEWGLGASLLMETLPAKARGLFSGILQQGYAFGFLLAAIVYWLVFPQFGWRGVSLRSGRCFGSDDHENKCTQKEN